MEGVPRIRNSSDLEGARGGKEVEEGLGRPSREGNAKASFGITLPGYQVGRMFWKTVNKVYVIYSMFNKIAFATITSIRII